MADQKLTALASLAAPSADDLIYVIDDAAGTPTSKQATLASLTTLYGPALATVIRSTDADLALAVNTIYYWDISGLAADRTATLPGTAAVGDLCGIKITTGDNAFEVLITATAGDTLDGVSGGTEWSRLFITGEFVLLRCTVANTTWVVVTDNRIPCKGLMEITSGPDGETAATFTTVTAASTPGVFTVIDNVGDMLTAASSLLTARRTGRYLVSVAGANKDNGTSTNYFGVRLLSSVGAAQSVLAEGTIPASVVRTFVSATKLQSLTTGDTLTYQYPLAGRRARGDRVAGLLPVGERGAAMSRVDVAEILIGMGFAVDTDFVASQTEPDSTTVEWRAAAPQPSDEEIDAFAAANPNAYAEAVQREKNTAQGRAVLLTASLSNQTTALANVGIGFQLAADRHYTFEFEGGYTTAAATTGLGLAVNGPANPTRVRMLVALATSATTAAYGGASAYDTVVLATTGPGATPMPFRVSGNISTGAESGPFLLRFRSEVAGSAVTILSGSYGKLLPVEAAGT